MKCAKCQAENREGAKFCNECGYSFEIECSKCNASNRPGSKFCDECGYTLSFPSEPAPKELSPEEKIDKIQKYLPKGLAEKILSQREKIEGERKQVTVMFCDMEDFTTLVDVLGTDEAYTLMDQVYEILIHKVHDYEGTVNEMTGDGIMALFGAPIALEDAPQRAIRSAIAIHREITKFNDRIRKEKENTPQLKMRIGVHTGSVVVGTLGNDLRVEFKVVGDTVNLASRMEGLAEPGSTYVTEDMFKQTEGFFRFEAMGQKEVKGKKEPVNVYRVIAPSTRRTRFDVNAESGLTSFVGREKELELLLDGLDRAKQGRGQAFSIIAEAGVGKSRLLYEFRKAVANEDITFLEGKCLSYSRQVAYHPIIDIYRSNFDIQENDDDQKIREKVKKGMKVLDMEEASILPYMLELLSVKGSGIDQIMISPQGREDHTIEMMTRIPLKGSEIRPLILVIEDLHWMDKTSEEVSKQLLESIAGARILLLFTYRPEFVHTWGQKSYHSQVNLNRLSNRETTTMVSHILDAEDIDQDLEELILEKTEGVPFFIEELIKSLNDLNAIEKKGNAYSLAKNIEDVAIPSTIQDMITARIDTLPEEAKELLQIGSVIEREFSHELIKAVTSLPEEQLLANLSVLKDAEILFERGIYPDSTYVFKHALTQDVVYDSIISKKKKSLHELIAITIEERYKNHLDLYYGNIANHYFESGNYAKAAEFYKLAARKAQRGASFAEAISFSEKHVACIEKLPQTQEIEMKRIDARTALGTYYSQHWIYGSMKSAIDPIIDLAEKYDYKRRLAQIYYILGANSWIIEEDFRKGADYLEKAIQISEETENINAMILSNHYLGHIFIEEGEFEKGYHYINKALEIAKMVNSQWGIAMHTSCIAFNIYYNQGKIGLAYETSSEGLRLAEDSGDILSKIEAYVDHGVCSFGKGLFNEAEEYLSKGRELSDRVKTYTFSFQCAFNLGRISQLTGNYRKAIECYKDALSHESYGIMGPSFFDVARMGLAYAKVMNDDKDIDVSTLCKLPSGNRMQRFNGLMKRVLGNVLLNLDADYLPQAEQWILKAVEADTENGMKFEIGLDYVSHAEVFKRKEDISRTKEKLRQAIDIFKKCGSDGWVEKYEKELAEL